ncbi:MAG TPA: hydroxymethylglutaryl-CoA lyase [Fimbriimonadaceae bacterium]|mgnify:CR=1 FL=1|nr:hydroxymethylglutaryl-CoA lyase [Fimbriimonadaceae bacterium]HRJ32955.1 hydroxymethylglutaryl-CoA lyase [Fimbriimonadaceae bacterium]
MTILEVGPRDGLQNEPIPIPTEVKVEFIRGLVESGLREIEATSFVSPKWVPQMGDASDLWPQLPSGAQFSALVPNLKGLESALQVGCDRIALFTAASDAFTLKNINKTVLESIEVFREVMAAFRAQAPGGFVRAYVSTAFECPYAGRIDPEQVMVVVERILELGVDEISIGDTIGAASTNEVHALTKVLLEEVSLDQLAYHFHDTRGGAIANVAAALEHGVHRFDASAAGLGGCPYAPGAGGNLATEDLVYFLERNGVATGIDLAKLAQASRPVLQHLGRGPISKVQIWELAREKR